MIDEDINERMARLVPQPGGVGEMPSQIPLGISMTPTFERPNAAPDIDTDYADAARRIADSRRTQMMSSLVNITAVDPDSAARSQKLGSQFGVGGDLAARNAEELRQRAFIDSISGRDMLRRNPVLADYIAQRQFAEIAHDDVDALAKTEQEFSKGWFTRFVSEGIAGIGEGFGRAVAQDEMASIYERQRQRGGRLEVYEKAALDSYREEMAKGGERTGFLEEAAYIGSQQLTGAPRIIEAGMMGATAGGGLGLVGGPAGFATVPAGMATGFAAGLAAGAFENSRRLETAMLYGELQPELGHESADRIATTVGIFNAALDTGAAALVAKPFAGLLRGAVRQKVSEAIRQQTTRAALANAAKAYGIGVAGEVTTETVQELNNVIGSEIGRYMADKPMEIETEEGREAIATRLVDTFVATAMGMSIMGAPGPAGRLYVDTRAAKQGEQQAAKLQSMVKAIADNKLLARSPERLEEFAESAVEGTDSETTYVNAAVMHDILRQSGITEQEMDTVLPGVRAQLTEMQQNGIDLGNNDVTVPTAQMTVRLQKTPLLNQILPHARLSPDAMSITEVQQFEANREQLVAEARQIMETRQETDATFVAEAQAIEDRIFGEVTAAGIEGMDERAARANAQFVRDMYVTMAARMNVSPAEVERRFPYRVQGEVAPLEQADQFDQAGQRKTDTPAFRKWSREATVVDEDSNETYDYKTGSPVVVFGHHGTPRFGFQQFEPSFRGERTGAESAKEGYFFSAGSLTATTYTLTQPTMRADARSAVRELETHVAALGPKLVELAKSDEDWKKSLNYLTGMYLVVNPAGEFDLQFLKQEINKQSQYGAAGQELEYAYQLIELAYEFKYMKLGEFPEQLENQLVDLENQFPVPNDRAGSGVYRSWLRMTNPFVVDLRGGGYQETRFSKIIRDAKEQGYDSVIIKNAEDAWYEGIRDTIFVVFDNRQIKDADRNVGTYNETANMFDQAATLDANYLAAVERGDMDTAQRMVDEAARVQGQEAVTRDEQGNVVPLSRRFDITSPKLFEQAPVSPGFYSALAKAVDAIDAKSIAPSGWKERIKGLVNKGEIKQDEVDWSGLTDWLDMQEGKVTKESVAEFLKNNGVRVERVQLGGTSPEQERLVKELTAEYDRADVEFQAAKEARRLASEGADDVALNAAEDRFIQARRARAEVSNRLSEAEEAKRSQRGQATKFGGGNLVLPGGENYREVLITIPFGVSPPAPGLSKSGLAARQEIFDKYAPQLQALEKEISSLMFRSSLTDEEAQRLADAGNERDDLEERRREEANAAYRIPEKTKPFNFESSHWQQPNVLVHFRLNDRIDADGKRVLFVEEIQSDWGQRGADGGFVNQRAEDEAELNRLLKKAEESPSESLDKQIRRLRNRLEKGTYGLPVAPFVTKTDGWLNLGLKHILLEATQGNYDRVAFVNGEQSAERYYLSKQVSRVVYQDNYDVKIKLEGPPTVGRIIAYNKQGEPVLNKPVETPAELENIVGKEVAKRIFDAKPQLGNYAGLEARQRELSGLDLKVGGSGMVEFYDNIVPLAVNKLLKKYGGGKLGNVVLPNMRQQEMEADAERMGMNVADVLDLADDAEYAQAQPGFDITPEMVTKLESGLPLFQAAAGPARGGFDPRRLTTILNKNADLSTFLHETAHFYLHVLGQMASDPAATPEIRADMDTLLSWFGIAGDTAEARLAAWNAMSIDQQRKYHEQFAYSFEVYLFDGKSPSVEMQGLFERFSSWLRRVYKTITETPATVYRREFGEDLPILTGEVRQVMDRMLATEEQIKRQAAINEMKPQFQTLEQALASGMTEAEYAAYQVMLQEAMDAAVTDMTKASLRQMQWLGNARSRLLRDLQRKHDRQRKEVRDEVAEEIRLQPVYRAMEYLRTGTFVDSDGQSVKMEGPHRLDMEAVRNIYAGMPTPESLEAIRAPGMAMPKNVAPDIAALGTGGKGMMGKDGIDPDVAAELFGYSSGDALIRALLAATPMKDAIDARTDEVMLARFSDLVDPKARDAAVQTALHNEARARFVAVELRFVAKATQPTRVLIEAARQAAREMIAGKRIVDVKPQEFIAAESRAARDAADLGKYEAQAKITGKAEYDRVRLAALSAGSTEEDAVRVAEEAQAAFVAARTAEREAEFKARFGASTVQQALIRAKRAQLYQNQLAAEALRVREEVDKDVKYLRQVLRDSNVKRMGADYADQIERVLERFNLARLSAKARAERQSLVEWLAKLEQDGLVPDLAPEVIDEANRKPYQEMTVAEFRDLVEAVKQLEYIGKNAQKIKRAEEMAEFNEVRDEIVDSIKSNYTGKVTKPRTPTTAAGRRIAGMKRFLYSHLKAAAIARIFDGGKDDGPVWRYLIRTANAAGDMETRMRAEATKRLTEILAPVFKLGKMGGKGVYFPTIGQSLNREARLVIALNMGNDGNRQRLLDGEGWTLEQLTPVLESLTEAEWNAVQQVWDFLETYRPLIAAKERRLYGKEPNWVTPTPFTVRTADGKEVRLSGGYYPIKYDPVATERAETAEEAEAAKAQLRSAYTAATTRRSFTKARARQVRGRPLLYTMSGVYGGVNDVIHDLSWHEWLIQANRLMRDEKFSSTVRETYGVEAVRQLKDWIKDNAAGEQASQGAADQAVSILRRNVSAAGLGFNVVSAALQVTGFSQSIVRVGAKHIARGVALTVGSPIATFKAVNEKSSFMAERSRTQFRELNELRNMVQDESASGRRLRLGTYFLMMRMQRMVDVPTWVGAYEKALEAGKDEDTAVALADQAVIDSQGGGMLKDLSAAERGGPVSKLFTVFYSYMNTVYNMGAVSTMTPRSKGRLASDYLMLFVVPVVLNYALKNALTPDVDDEEPDLEKIAKDLIAEELAFLMGMMVVVREFQNVANVVTGKETGARGYEGPAGLRGIGETMKFATQASQGEFDRAFRKSAVNMLGLATGLPSAQINRTLDGIEALSEGETENPLAPLTGVKR